VEPPEKQRYILCHQMTLTLIFGTHIATLVANIYNTIVNIGRGTTRQQQGDNHQGALFVIARRQGRGFRGVQVRANSEKYAKVFTAER